MKLLARLLSHGFAIVVVVLLAIGFIYRGELFPEWELPDFLALDSAESTADDAPAGKIEPAPIQGDWMASGSDTGGQQAPDVEDAAVSMDDVADAVPLVEEVVEDSAPMIAESVPADVSESVDAGAAEIPVAPAIEEDMLATEVPAPAAAVEEPVAPDVQEYVEELTTPVSETIADSETVISPAPVTAADSAAEAASTVVAEEAAAPVADVMTDSAPPAPETVTEPVVDVGDAPEPVESAAPMAESIADGETAQVEADEAPSYYQLLASAREAYWLRDYQTAEDFYRKMIVDDPDNPDGYGELANMYFSQGNWDLASLAYYEAGLRLVKSGLLAQARGLVEVIRGLNGPQADALDQEIQAARGSSQ